MEPGDREVLVTGAERDFEFDASDADTVSIALIACEYVEQDNGWVTFHEDALTQDSEDQSYVDFADYEGDATIESVTVNGAIFPTTGQDRVDNVPGGDVEFTVDHDTDTECVRAVVFVEDDTEDGGQLTTDEGGEPQTDFGVGGETVFADETLAVSPQDDETNRWGEDHTVTASIVLDGYTEDDEAVAAEDREGEQIVFRTYRFDDQDDVDDQGGTDAPVDQCPTAEELRDDHEANLVRQAVRTTDENGEATLTYTYTQATEWGDEGDDVYDCVMAFWDQDETLTWDETEEPADVTGVKTWTDAPATATEVEFTESESFNQVGTTHTATAVVTDQYGDPVAGEPVEFDTGTTTAVRTTNNDGEANFSYVGPATSDHHGITATIYEEWDPAPAGEIDSDTQNKYWVEEGDSDIDDADVLGADFDDNIIYVEDNGDYYWYDWDDADQYRVNDAARTQSTWETRLAEWLDDNEDVSLDVDGLDDDDELVEFNISN